MCLCLSVYVLVVCAGVKVCVFGMRCVRRRWLCACTRFHPVFSRMYSQRGVGRDRITQWLLCMYKRGPQEDRLSVRCSLVK